MKKAERKWKPKIINVMTDGSVIEDLTGYIIPPSHQYYEIIKGINKV